MTVLDSAAPADQAEQPSSAADGGGIGERVRELYDTGIELGLFGGHQTFRNIHL